MRMVLTEETLDSVERRSRAERLTTLVRSSKRIYDKLFWPSAISVILGGATISWWQIDDALHSAPAHHDCQETLSYSKSAGNGGPVESPNHERASVSVSSILDDGSVSVGFTWHGKTTKKKVQQNEGAIVEHRLPFGNNNTIVLTLDPHQRAVTTRCEPGSETQATPSPAALPS